ncbi:MAG: homoserine kinase [Oscillospiraceae bacterium]|nr:homoserine kinase [Oscillospiraceae bacterium]
MIKIKIPATSANIGSGFDSLGVALNMYNYVNMKEHDFVEIRSLDGVSVPTDTNNLIYKTVKYMFDLCGKPLNGLYIEQVSRIPLARGLGSSSACIAAGVMGANALMGFPLSKDELINAAAKLEGHPDNSTPAIAGGLVTAVIDNDKVYYVKQPLRDDLTFAAIIPDFELKTSKARSVIPKEISHKNGVFNLSRAALMSVSLYSGNYQNLRVACDDRLHQPYRLPLIKGANEVFNGVYQLGAYGAYISGAGSTLMAIVDKNNAQFAQDCRAMLDSLGHNGWALEMLSIDNEGAQLVCE